MVRRLEGLHGLDRLASVVAVDAVDAVPDLLESLLHLLDVLPGVAALQNWISHWVAPFTKWPAGSHRDGASAFGRPFGQILRVR